MHPNILKPEIWVVLLLLTMIFYSDQTDAQENPTGTCQARLSVEIENGFADVQAVCQTVSDEKNLRYEFEMAKTGPNGSSKNSQEGRFDTLAGELKKLSRQRINFSEKDDILFTLKIYKRNDLIAEDSVNGEALRTGGRRQ